MTWGDTAGTMIFDHTRGHACNCIGCCRKCGGCLTAPWHAATCDRVAALRQEIAQVIRSESDRLATRAPERRSA